MPAEKNVINIISNCATSDSVTGPQKVFKNACKGFELIGQPYVVNRSLSDYSWNWVHDSGDALIEVALRGLPAVIGPNLVVLPHELPKYRPRLRKCIYLQPSEWVVSLWREMGFSECPLSAWPVGIDCRSFKVKGETSYNNSVMIYYKDRSPELLDEVRQIVTRHQLSAHLISYGDYTENEFRDVLTKCSFGIWLGRHESQGIALQEALAADVPLIVIDAKSLFDAYGENSYSFPVSLKSFETTSAPYFDSRCGIIIDDISKLDSAIITVKTQFPVFAPRCFVEDNISLEISAKILVDIFFQLKIGNQNRSSPIDSNIFATRYSTRFISKINRAHNSLLSFRNK